MRRRVTPRGPEGSSLPLACMCVAMQVQERSRFVLSKRGFPVKLLFELRSDVGVSLWCAGTADVIAPPTNGALLSAIVIRDGVSTTRRAVHDIVVPTTL